MLHAAGGARRFVRCFALFQWLLLFGSTGVRGDELAPPDGLRRVQPRRWVLTGARIFVTPERLIDGGSLWIEDGRVRGVGLETRAPAEVPRIDLAGRTIYAGWIDAYGEGDADTGPLRSGTPYWNDTVRPQVTASLATARAGDSDEELRRQGVVARLVAPRGGIVAGQSRLLSTGNPESRDALLSTPAAMHLRLTVPRGRSRRLYPNSPMGAVALARQAFLDADWYRRAEEAWRADRQLPRPAQNSALEALLHHVDSGGLVIGDAYNPRYFLRTDRFAREFSLRLALLGSGEEYQRLDAIRATGRSVILPLEYPDAPDVASFESALDVSLRTLLHWDLAPENAARLDGAGVRVAFTSHGLSSKNQLLERLRRTVERGLSRTGALRALTTTPAELFGVADRLGSLRPGSLASFFVTDGDVFTKETRLLETWVAGERYEFESTPPVDLSGTWKLQIEDRPGGDGVTLEITQDGHSLSGTLRLATEHPVETALNRAKLTDLALQAQFDGGPFQAPGVARLSASAEAVNDGRAGRLRGHITWPKGQRSGFDARPRESSLGDSGDGEKENEKGNENETEKKGEGSDVSPEASTAPQEVIEADAAKSQVNWPLGAWGRTERPVAPTHVLLRNGTVWTCSERGVLEGADVLFGDGRILEVGDSIAPPEGALVIDLDGRHVTPGIIDCHSHAATDGGVNESGQAITAEVRIGDFIDCDDIEIYRQLAGGVTSINILHGSANPIGGQNRVIKLRWGLLPDELVFAEAPAGIKFALGENVKRSNWSQASSRYPQTRMGVEQIIRDAFSAARAYRATERVWNIEHEGLPPRRDLELEALAEILEGRRWIHCHSYRQDEILALIRTLDEFDIRIGTFQHILEGYKVADAMAQHGAMASAFSDWWAYKVEVQDAIPYNGALMHGYGLTVSFNSDDRELARHLNHEAAKAVRYGGVPEPEALKFVTLNPAKQLRIDAWVGSLEADKHADLVIWSGHPLAITSRCEQTWIDGARYFDVEEDARLREAAHTERERLVQKALRSGKTDSPAREKRVREVDRWDRHDRFCRAHADHDEHRDGVEEEDE